MSKELERYFGTYRGVSPADESEIGIGELELSIGVHLIKIRHATGLSIDEQSMVTSHVRKLPEEEVQALLKNPKDCKEVDGFRIGADGPIFLFFRDSDVDSAMLIVLLEELAAIPGPMFLFGPEQITNGAFDRTVEEIMEEDGEDALPRLAYGGKAKL